MYEKEGHIIVDPVDKLNYSVRLQQFFDHYLKGASALKWMTRGSLRDMDIKEGLELDYSDKRP
jgi:hypothetical protein